MRPLSRRLTKLEGFSGSLGALTDEQLDARLLDVARRIDSAAPGLGFADDVAALLENMTDDRLACLIARCREAPAYAKA